jgi:hypothetical protein
MNAKEPHTISATCARILPHRDLYFAIGVAVLTTAVHVSGEIVDQYKFFQSDLAILRSPTVPRLLLLSGMSLLICTLALCTRRLCGLIVSIFGLLMAGFGYIVWFVYSRWLLKVLAEKSLYENQESLPPHPLGLVGAKWWNLVVLIMVASLLVWEIKTLAAILNSRRLSRD